MKVFKATNADMSCHMGRGTFQYFLGQTATAESSKCGNTGLHACEYVLDCMNYYGMGKGNRFFEAEASGDIAEDGVNTRISCTELTLVRELTVRDIAREAMKYMLRHPKRNWEHSGRGAVAAKERAEAVQPDGIAIARGTDPAVRGCAGSCLGLIRETEEGIREARLFTVEGSIRPGVWYTVEEAKKAAGEV